MSKLLVLSVLMLSALVLERCQPDREPDHPTDFSAPAASADMAIQRQQRRARRERVAWNALA